MSEQVYKRCLMYLPGFFHLLLLFPQELRSIDINSLTSASSMTDVPNSLPTHAPLQVKGTFVYLWRSREFLTAEDYSQPHHHNTGQLSFQKDSVYKNTHNASLLYVTHSHRKLHRVGVLKCFRPRATFAWVFLCYNCNSQNWMTQFAISLKVWAPWIFCGPF